MGGDHGPSVTVPAALQALHQYPTLQLILVGDERLLKKAAGDPLPPRLTIQHASERVEMDELPSQALRTKKDSSMRIAINLVKDGKAQACVSAGNTGALMATARFVLKMLPGIDRPAIVSSFPTYDSDKSMRMLDLGANVDCSADNLMQFAIMGSVLAGVMDNIDQPTVYLLNIGAEEIKGNEQVKKTAQLLSQLAQSQKLNYAGYIEGDAIFRGQADVVVCDGFVGNVTLKTTEGVAVFIKRLMKEAFMHNWLTKLVGLLVKPVLGSFAKRIDPDIYNGATFIGLQGVVIKSHGGAKIPAFVCAIEEAMIQVEKNVIEQIRYKVEQLLKSASPHDE